MKWFSRNWKTRTFLYNFTICGFCRIFGEFTTLAFTRQHESKLKCRLENLLQQQLPSSDVVNNKFSSSKSNLRSMFAPISNVDPLLPLPTVFQTVEIFKQKDICKCGILILIFPHNISHENCRHTKTNVNSEIWPDRFNPIERGKINWSIHTKALWLNFPHFEVILMTFVALFSLAKLNLKIWQHLVIIK